MRDWLFVIIPIAVVCYFVVYPEQFHALMLWVEQFTD